MSDMSAIIVPKSDQINADDLLGRTITITVTKVTIRGGQEQPISIHFEGSDKVFRPCKSMCRVMAQAWGLDSALYAGRSMTLYCDPTVKFGPLAVGGIRISHMSHIDGPMTMALTATKGVKKSFKVLPLAAVVDQGLSVDQAEADLRAAFTLDELRATWSRKAMAPHRAALQPVLDELKASLSNVDFVEASSANRLNGVIDEGPADADRGEAHTNAALVSTILSDLDIAANVNTVGAIMEQYRVQIDALDEGEKGSVYAARDAAMKALRGSAK